MTDILGRFGLARVINATGTVTRLGASPLDAEVIDAMAAAAQCSVDIAELQGRACEYIARATGAEAGIVTSGAMAGLLVGAAACMAGLDPTKMAQLPDTRGMRCEFIVARSHRNSYDHGVRAAGARLVEVGLPDRMTGCGVRDTEAWEIESAIGDRTAGILYLAGADARPPLAAVVRVAQAAGVPVLVDAAAELPPAHNLRRFIAEGADLVAFSGGKALGGPTASGILCGRKDLVASALLQQLDLDYVSEEWQPPPHLIERAALRGVPRHGIGRSCKVGKEQIVGLLTALDRFLREGDAARNARFALVTDTLLNALSAIAGLHVRRVSDAAHGGLPLVEVRVSPAAPDSGDAATEGAFQAAAAPSGLVTPTGFAPVTSARQLAARLRAATPAVHVDATRADQGVLMLVPTCLRGDDAAAVARGFQAALGAV